MPISEEKLLALKHFLINHYLALSVFIACGLLLLGESADPDLFARLAVGKLIDNLGYVPLQDPFAFSPKKAIWVDHEWLSGVVFYNLYYLWGDFGLYAFKLLFFALTSYIVLSAGTMFVRPGFGVLCFSLLLLADANYAWASTVRSQVFTYFFLAIYLYIFADFYKNNKRTSLLALPLMMVLWCNLHGGFVVGLGLQFLFMVCNLKHAAIFQSLIMLFSALATALNPYGFIEYWNYILEAVTMKRPSISEWAPLGLGLNSLIPFLAFASAVVALISRKRPLFVYIFFVVSAFFAVTHQRHLAIFYFVCLAFIPDSFNWQLRTTGTLTGKIKVSLCLTLVCFACYFAYKAVVLIIYFNQFSLSYVNYPEKAVNKLLDEGKGGNLLVDFNNGSYALWKLYPRYLVSLDGRYEELYPDSTLELVNKAFNCKSLEHAFALESLKPDYVIVDSASPCFTDEKLLHEDEQYKVYSLK